MGNKVGSYNFLSYFLPTSSHHHALNDFRNLTGPKRVLVIVVSFFASILPVFGTCAAFRKMTQIFQPEGTAKATSQIATTHFGGTTEKKEPAKNEESKQVEKARISTEIKNANEVENLEAQRKAELAKKEEEAKQAEEAQRAEIEKQLEEQRKAEEARIAELAKKEEEAKQAEEAKRAEIEKQLEEQRNAEEARIAELAKREEEAKQAEETKAKEEAKVKAEALLNQESQKINSIDEEQRNNAIKKLRTGEWKFKDLKQPLREDPVIAQEAIKIDARNFSYLSQPQKLNRENRSDVILQLKRESVEFQELHETLRGDRLIAEEAVLLNPLNFRFVSDSLKAAADSTPWISTSTVNAISNQVQNNSVRFEELHEALRGKRLIALEAVRLNPLNFRFVSDSLKAEVGTNSFTKSVEGTVSKKLKDGIVHFNALDPILQAQPAIQMFKK